MNKPGKDICSVDDRGHREISWIRHDPRHWPGPRYELSIIVGYDLNWFKDVILREANVSVSRPFMGTEHIPILFDEMGADPIEDTPGDYRIAMEMRIAFNEACRGLGREKGTAKSHSATMLLVANRNYPKLSTDQVSQTIDAIKKRLESAAQ